MADIEKKIKNIIIFVFYFLKVGQKSYPYCVCMYVGPLQDKEQKCSTQNSTQTLLIKVISLKE